MSTDASEAQVTYRASVCKIDDEQRRVFGFALTATDSNGKEVIDHQGDVLSVRELEEASFEYVTKSREAGVMHTGDSVGHLICAVPMTPDIRKAMGVPPGPSALFVGYQITSDAAWADIKKRGLSEFSIEGDAFRDPIQ